MDWAYMLKLGTNMWCDIVPPKWANYAADELHYKGPSDHLRCDDALWREVTDRAHAAGFNMHPSKEEYEKVIAANDPNKYQLMAMNVLASGSITVQQSFDYINNLNLQSVVFGASSKGHIKSTVEAIHLK